MKSVLEDERPADSQNHWKTLKTLSRHLWPADRRSLQVRVVIALSCLFGARVVSVYIPVIYKDAVDALTATCYAPPHVRFLLLVVRSVGWFAGDDEPRDGFAVWGRGDPQVLGEVDQSDDRDAGDGPEQLGDADDPRSDDPAGHPHRCERQPDPVEPCQVGGR